VPAEKGQTEDRQEVAKRIWAETKLAQKHLPSDEELGILADLFLVDKSSLLDGEYEVSVHGFGTSKKPYAYQVWAALFPYIRAGGEHICGTFNACKTGTGKTIMQFTEIILTSHTRLLTNKYEESREVKDGRHLASEKREDQKDIDGKQRPCASQGRLRHFCCPCRVDSFARNLVLSNGVNIVSMPMKLLGEWCKKAQDLLNVESIGMKLFVQHIDEAANKNHRFGRISDQEAKSLRARVDFDALPKAQPRIESDFDMAEFDQESYKDYENGVYETNRLACAPSEIKGTITRPYLCRYILVYSREGLSTSGLGNQFRYEYQEYDVRLRNCKWHKKDAWKLERVKGRLIELFPVPNQLVVVYEAHLSAGGGSRFIARLLGGVSAQWVDRGSNANTPSVARFSFHSATLWTSGCQNILPMLEVTYCTSSLDVDENDDDYHPWENDGNRLRHALPPGVGVGFRIDVLQVDVKTVVKSENHFARSRSG
jgi:hypothetical protein